jgi:hypothetical protein
MTCLLSTQQLLGRSSQCVAVRCALTCKHRESTAPLASNPDISQPKTGLALATVLQDVHNYATGCTLLLLATILVDTQLMLNSAGTYMTNKGSGLVPHVSSEHPLLTACDQAHPAVYMRLLSHRPSGCAQHEGAPHGRLRNRSPSWPPLMPGPCADARLMLTPCLRTHMRYQSPST